MGSISIPVDVVLTEPHPKHVPGQSELETMLHKVLDHLREPLLAHKPDNFHFLSGPWHQKNHKQHVFVPNVDMRETKHDYYFDIELPGVYDKSSINIEWTASRKLLIEGEIERPSLTDTFGLSREWDSKERGEGENGDVNYDDDVNAWENGGHIPVNKDNVMGNQIDEDFFPINVVDGVQLDEGDMRMSKIKTNKSMPKDEVMGSKIHNLNSMNPDRAATLNIAERSIGRYMRLFMFPANVYRAGLRSKLENGLLKIVVPRTKFPLDES